MKYLLAMEFKDGENYQGPYSANEVMDFVEDDELHHIICLENDGPYKINAYYADDEFAQKWWDIHRWSYGPGDTLPLFIEENCDAAREAILEDNDCVDSWDSFQDWV